MSSARNHQRRSHRSEKFHYACVHQMKRFIPAGIQNRTPLPTNLFRPAGRHRLGRVRRDRAGAAE